MKQFITHMRDLIAHILALLSLMKQLNGTMFQENPITYLELYQWCQLHGTKKVLSDLQEAWDRHNFYDQETL